MTLTPPAGPQAFLTHEVGFERAFAVARLLWPTFEKVRGCILIRGNDTDAVLEQWWATLNGDIASIEAVVNHVHLWDIFPPERDDPIESQVLTDFASILAGTWRSAISEQFPGRPFTVEFSGGAQDYGPTVTANSTSQTTP